MPRQINRDKRARDLTLRARQDAEKNIEAKTRITFTTVGWDILLRYMSGETLTDADRAAIEDIDRSNRMPLTARARLLPLLADPSKTVADYVEINGPEEYDKPWAMRAFFQGLPWDVVGAAAAAQAAAATDATTKANAAQSAAIQRSNHTGTQAAATISDFSTAVLNVAYPSASNPAGYLTSITSSQVTTALGFTPYNATNPNNYITQAGARGAISLTTTGTTGAATYNNSTGVLNIPQYQSSGGTVTNVSGTAPITSSGGNTPAIGISAASTSAAGSMSSADKTKLDAYPVYAARSFTTPTLSSATTATQLSATRDAQVNYEFDASVAITVLGSQTVNAILTYADNAGMTTNPVVLDSQTLTGGGILNLTLSTTLNLKGIVPAGKYRRVTFTVSATGIGLGNPTAPSAIKSGQEVLL